MASLLLLGAGGHARVVAETALSTGRFSSIAFLDDRCSGPAQLPDQLGWPVIGPFSAAHDRQICQQFQAALVAIGNATVRLQWLPRLAAAGYELPVVIHPTAWLSPSAQLGAGSVVFAQAAIQAQAMIGSGAILNTGCSVDHDAQLGDGVHICPGARLAGEVQVGDRSWIGIGASMIQQICIGADVTVGAGASVVRDLPDGVTAVGVPARVLPTA
ncbi:acetyltransferase [Synechococcus sp. MVIR-18-1]|uniref:acetyltransferase n=1 Tax=Synechococcus sp. MVIR-18-1 TaxID=1386941 RepID=UPI00164881E4|nr:acetyltransferase [Synechococcus sp. MVIR-18-1]QNI75247.1 bacterial transferase hexapeptide family protein [Synechococcus sp. MVIR-18-1]